MLAQQPGLENEPRVEDGDIFESEIEPCMSRLSRVHCICRAGFVLGYFAAQGYGPLVVQIHNINSSDDQPRDVNDRLRKVEMVHNLRLR